MSKIKDYFSSKRINVSLLASLINPRWVKMKMDHPEMEDDDKKHFRVGSALDCLLTDSDNFDSQFHVVDAIRPFGYMGKFVETLPASLTPDCDIALYQDAYNAAGYKMKIERVVDSFWTNPTAVEYYNATRNTYNKTILSKDEHETVISCRDKIVANPFTYKYFINHDSHIELQHQLPIYFDYMGEQCKALMDGIRINHDTKVIEPFDLKTIGKNVYDFPISFLQYGYFRQAAYYSAALQQYIANERPELKSYKIAPFIFIVVDSKLSSSYPAIIYETTSNDITSGILGGTSGGRHYKGVNELMEALIYHRSSGQWDLPKDVYENQGRLKLDVFAHIENTI